MAYQTVEIDRSKYKLQLVDGIFGENVIPNWYNGIVSNELGTIITPNTNKQQLALDITIFPVTQIYPGGVKISNLKETFYFLEDHALAPTDTYEYSGKHKEVSLNGTRIHGSEINYLQCPSGDFKYKISLLEKTSAQVLIEIKPWV